jgi:uncharacterized OsmC-like protein
MDFGILFKNVGKVAAENSPALLTALGVSGALTTAYLAAKAGFKSKDVLVEAEEAKREEHFTDQTNDAGESVEVEFKGLTTQEKVEAVWHLYAPAAASAALTVAAIILAARVADRRNAALAAAYTTVEKSYTEYRAKNVEKIGVKKEKDLRDEIALDQIDKHPFRDSTFVVTGKGNTRCFDAYSGRYFTSDAESIRQAVNNINALIINDGYASLSDFWEELDIPSTTDSGEMGWNTDKLIEISQPFPARVSPEDGEPCLVLVFNVLPRPRYYRSSY